MKLGINFSAFNCFKPQNTYEYLDYAKKYQFDCVDFALDSYYHIFDWRKFDDEEIIKHFTEVKAYADKIGIKFSQTHAPFAGFPGYLNEEFFDWTRKSLLITSLLGAPYCVIHPLVFPIYNKRPLDEDEKKYNIEFYTRLIPYIKQYNVKVALENLYDWKEGSIRFIYISHPTGLKEYVDALPEEYFVYCLDTGHLHMAGHKQSEAIKLWGNRLKVLHMHDSFGILDDHFLPFFGSIDWQDFASALKEISFDGVLSLEIKPFAYLGYAESGFHFVRELLDRIRNMAK
ncbi:MAG: sugar phosphate isomerase/epimerase [Bacilli bacterium]|nr:sugar phosphate isomerase/epimerase [Bacilli bacterium]